MNKVILSSLLITSLLLTNQFSNAQCHLDDWTALKALYESTNGDNWKYNIGWEIVTGDEPSADCDLSTLAAIYLNDAGRVSTIYLSNNNLQGIIPPEIGQLSSLTQLYFMKNQLSGSIPVEIGNLSNLSGLYLEFNNLSGEIPTEIGNLNNLSRITLHNNQLSGCYSNQLINLCDQLSANSTISIGNNFDATWEDFCATGNGSCTTQRQGCRYTDSLALVALHQSLNGDLWNFSTRMDTWQGVKLNERGCVDELELIYVFGKSSSGFLPKEIGDLAEVTSIFLSNNNISGAIPPEIGKLTNLKQLFLSDNKFEGEIPAAIGNLTQLETLDLYYNQFLTTMPTTIGNLTNLQNLYLQENQIVNIPESIGNLINLKELVLGFNQIKTIPESIGNLTQLTHLQLAGNQISTIPASIINLNKLTNLQLGSNQISAIPTGFDNLTKLKYLNLGQNNLATFPSSINNLNDLINLNLADNQITGELPGWLSNKPQLKNLMVQSNNFSGCYAPELKQLCSQLYPILNKNQYISDDNNFDATWEDFCATNAGICAPPNCHIDDWTALKALYESTNGNNWTNSAGWDMVIANQDFPSENCDLNGLDGIGLDDKGRVKNIVFLYNNMTGFLPAEISLLSNIEGLWLFGNSITGSIPPEIGQLNNLKFLMIYDNDLNGSIPREIGNLSNLVSLGLNNNNLSGSIPAEIGNLQELEDLLLDENQLTGSIPSEIGALDNLIYLLLAGNQLSGCYANELKQLCNQVTPTFQISITGPFSPYVDAISYGNNFDASWEEFCATNAGICPSPNCHLDDWTALKALYESTNGNNWTNRAGWDTIIDNQNSPPNNCDLSELEGIGINDNGRVNFIFMFNNLEGSIPPEIGMLNNLEFLWLSGSGVSGSIPPEIGLLNNLTTLVLDYNKLSGFIPPEIGNLTNLVELHLSENMLSGEIPTEIGNLYKLKYLTLYKNQLTGEIPATIGKLGNLSHLFLMYNQLSGCYADELRQLCNKIPSEFVFIPPYPIDPISEGNNFEATWGDFCQSNLGACPQLAPAPALLAVPTNYSNSVEVTATLNENGKYELKNNYVKVLDYTTCELADFDNCEPVVVSLVNGNYKERPNTSIFKKNTDTIIYGAGDYIERKSMTAPDIVGHEFMHHVINSTSNLLNYGETGALNESFADIFGEVLEYLCYGENDWIFGSKVAIDKQGIRGLSNPKDANMVYQLPDTHAGDSWVSQEETCFHVDLCGVHINNGVQNYWFYLLANGGEGINDNGVYYNIKGVGIDTAARIAFTNLFNLPRNAIYNHAVYGSINAAKALYSENPFIVEQTTKAWEAVGLDTGNPITWKTENSKFDTIINSLDEIINSNMPISFDLVIDSLGLDVSMDNLNFTLYIPDDYTNMNIGSIYEPLRREDVIIKPNEDKSEIEINIDLKNLQFNKKARVKQRAKSGGRVVSIIGCLLIKDVSDGCFKVPPIRISGGTSISENYTENFETSTLLFAPSCKREQNSIYYYYSEQDSSVVNNIASIDNNILNVALALQNKNCSKLGALEVEVLEEESNSSDYYYYNLYDNNESLIDSSTISNNLKHQFYNLDEGSYRLVVESIFGGYFIKNFEVSFVASAYGNYCCSSNVTVPEGEVEGNFTATDAINIENGTTIKSGDFEICE